MNAPPRRPRAPSGPRETAELETPAGVFVAQFTPQGLARLELPRPGRARPSCALPPPLSPHARALAARTVAALEAFFDGRPPADVPPLDLSAGTGFQRAVWAALCDIPRSQTRSYGEVAAAIGRPKAVRAVGQACGANPVPVFVPCHRVLAHGGRLGGFGGGLEWKRRLLQLEGRPGA